MSETKNRIDGYISGLRRLPRRLGELTGLAAAAESPPAVASSTGDALALAATFKQWGDAALGESDRLVPGDNNVAAIRLYCDALVSASAVARKEGEDALPAFPRDTLLNVVDSEETLEALRPLFEGTLTSICALDAKLRRRQAIVLQRLTAAVLQAAGAEQRALARGMWVRPLRIASTFICLVGLGSFGWYCSTEHTDLARRSVWRLSSSTGPCRSLDDGGCGARRGIFFHTEREVNAWIEYDLGRRIKFTKVVVENARDGFTERAIPLIVEVSDDQQDWREIARKTENFSEWTNSFRGIAARYVRFRVNRDSYLHLARIEILR